MTVIATTPHPSSPEEGITTGDGTKHYLAFASDRHQNLSATDSSTPVVSTAMSCWSDLPVEYVSLVGDMVGKTKGDAPTYDVKDVWDEVNAVFPSLTVDRFSIIWADHDGGYTDPSGIGVMKVPSTSTSDYGNKSTQIYTDADHNYYIYAVNYYEMLNNTSAEPEAFKEWVDGIDKSALIIVLCHAPMHYLRKDNLNGENWCNALNYAATGSENGTEVTRNVVFFHGHNHTSENAEYYYEPGTKVNMQGSGGSVSKTIQFTYITAGYMKKPSGANTVNATLLTMDDDEITFTKSKSGATSILGTVERVSGEDVTYYTVTFETNGGTAVEPQVVKDGDLLGPIGETTREGYTFAGWYKDEALTTEYNFLYPVKSDFTLYAKWTAIVYHTVTFNTNGGTAVASQKLEDGSCATEPTAPTLNGFTFAGWYSDEALTTEYDFTKPVTSDITIYAKWVAVTEACASPNLSYQNGKIVCTCATEGVTYQYTVALSNTEGTCTDGIITIGPTVTVTVRATREGMLDSAPTAIQLNLPAVGDVNGDGDITIADVTALVNTILTN